MFNPFPGLRPFRSDEDHLFFGREEQTAELLTLLRTHRFTAVVGTSGSGKSSLVRAGVLPELLAGTMNVAGSAWEVAVLRPGGRPLRNLATALTEADLYPVGPDDGEEAEVLSSLLATLRDSSLGLIEAVRQSEIEPGANLLVVVDQFEEIFRYRGSGGVPEEEAAAFVQLLLEASRQEAVPIYVVLTMRSDYLGDCARFPGLAAAVNAGEYLIPQLGRDQLERAVTGPVQVAGGRIAYRLLQELLNDASGEQDRLPVLQHALMRTWERWAQSGGEEGSSDGLDLEHYRAVGGTAQALSRHADEIYAELGDEELRRIARRLFQALTERGADNRGIRRPTPLATLAEIATAESEQVLQVIEAYRAAGRTFLMPLQPTPISAETVVDISHESLMRAWERLGRWVEEEAQSVRIYRRLAETAALAERGEAGLLEDPELEIAASWREEEAPTAAWGERYHPGFARAMRFLEESVEADAAREREREAERQRALEQARRLAEEQRLRTEAQQRSGRRLRRLMAVLGVVALGAIAATAVAAWSGLEARRSERRATASEARAAAGEREAARQLYVSDMSLASQAFARGEIERMLEILEGQRPATVDGDGEDRRGFEWFHWWRAGHLEDLRLGGPAGTGPMYHMAVAPDATTVADSGWLDNGNAAVSLYDVAGAEESGSLSVGHSPGNNSTLAPVAFSPDGRTFAAGHGSHVLLWDRSQPIGDHAGGRAVAHRLGGVGSRPIVNGRPRWQGANVTAIAFSPASTLVASCDEDGGLVLWDRALTAPRDRLAVLDLGGWCTDLAFSADGGLVFAATLDEPAENDAGGERIGTLFVVDVAGRRLTRRISRVGAQPIGTGGREAPTDRFQVAVSPLGDLVATAVGEIKLWNRRWESTGLAVDGAAVSAAFSPDGSRLAVGTALTNSIYVWSLDGAEPRLLTVIRAHGQVVQGVAFGTDSNTLWSMSEDTLLKRWRLDRSAPYFESQASTTSLAYRPDAKVLYLGNRGGPVRTWAVGVSAPAPASESPEIERAVVSADGRLAAEVSSSGTVRVHSLEDGSLRVERSLPEGTRLDVAVLSSDGRHFAFKDEDHRGIGLLDLESGGLIWLAEDTSFVADPVFSPDSSQVVVPTFGSTRSWAIGGEAPRLLWAVPGQGFEFCAAFSADGATVAIGGWNRDIRIHDAETGALRRRLEGSPGFVAALAFSPDGGTLASGGELGEVWIWDLPTGRVRSELVSHDAKLRAIAFSPDGGSLASQSDDGTIRLWRAASREEADADMEASLARLAASRREGRELEVREELGRLVRRFPGRPEPYAVFADRAAPSVGDYSFALEAVPDHPPFLERRAVLVMENAWRSEGAEQAEQWERAAADLTRLIEIGTPRRAFHSYWRGECFRRLGRLDEARADFAAALEESPARYLRDAVRLSLGVGALVPAAGVAGSIGSFEPFGTVMPQDEVDWRFTTAEPPADWRELDFDDGGWQSAPAPFGSYWQATDWAGDWGPGDIWMRHAFEVADDLRLERPLELWLSADDDVEIYLNGGLVARIPYPGEAEYYRWDLDASVKLRAGRNVLAVHCHDIGGPGRIDVGLYRAVSDEELERAVHP